MGRSAYSNSTGSSIRTFQTQPTVVDVPQSKPKRSLPKPPKLPVLPARVIAYRTPWLVAGVFAVLSLFLLVQYNSAKAKLHSPAASSAAAKQISDTLSKVSKLVIVPRGETPSVATVSNAAKLSGQSFFQNAQNGDKVIVYTKAKEAILYRPSTNQIVTIAPVSAPN